MQTMSTSHTYYVCNQHNLSGGTNVCAHHRIWLSKVYAFELDETVKRILYGLGWPIAC